MTTRQSERYQMQELLSAIQRTDSFLLFSHISPDGDTVGSALALKMALERLKKRVVLVLDGVVPESLFFLPDIYSFRKPDGEPLPTEGAIAIAVDVSSPERMGKALALYEQAPLTAQLDHHPTNPAYASINVIDGDAPATAVVVFRLIEALGLTLLREEAVCLYAALATDTGNFVYRNTNAEAFAMMARLMDAGLAVDTYARLLFRRKDRRFVALLARALTTIEYFCDGAMVGLYVTQADLKAAGASDEHTDGLVDYAIDSAGVKLGYFARETADGKIKLSLRALAPYRVDQVAGLFGGGGHQLAAGCTLDAPMEQALQTIRRELEKAYHGGARE